MSEINAPHNTGAGPPDQNSAGIWPPPPTQSSVAVHEFEGVKLLYDGNKLTIDCVGNRQIMILVLRVLLAFVAINFLLYSSDLVFPTMKAGSRSGPALVNAAAITLLYLMMFGGACWSYYTDRIGYFIYILDIQTGQCHAGRTRQFPLDQIAFVSVYRTGFPRKRYGVRFLKTTAQPESKFVELMTEKHIRFDISAFRNKEIAEEVAREIANFTGVEVRIV